MRVKLRDEMSTQQTEGENSKKEAKNLSTREMQHWDAKSIKR